MHGPGSTNVDVANEMATINDMIRFQMSYGKGYAAAIRSEMGIGASMIADDFLAGDTPYPPTVTRYKLLRGMQGRVIAAIHQKYNVS
jgi:hypothetical protein